MNHPRTLLSPTRRHGGAPARFMMASGPFLFAALIALGQEAAHPLKPPDRSSPRAALLTFLDSGDAVGSFMARDYLPSRSRAKHDHLVLLSETAVQCLDLSKVPPAARIQIARSEATRLYETLCRIQLPPIDEIPGTDQLGRLAGTNSARWVIPNTQIVLALAPSGPQTGGFCSARKPLPKRTTSTSESVPCLIPVLSPLRTCTRFWPKAGAG